MPQSTFVGCGQITGVTGISVFARVWTWVAVTVSVFVFAGLIRRSWRVLLGLGQARRRS